MVEGDSRPQKIKADPSSNYKGGIICDLVILVSTFSAKEKLIIVKISSAIISCHLFYLAMSIIQ